jgi:hypothetical protein
VQIADDFSAIQTFNQSRATQATARQRLVRFQEFLYESKRNEIPAAEATAQPVHDFMKSAIYFSIEIAP